MGRGYDLAGKWHSGHFVAFHPECGIKAPVPKELEPYKSWVDGLPEMSWWQQLWH